MANNDQTSAIKSFFNAKSVFLTGATGFVGKQILEKLLRSCPGIDRIYILVRSKHGVHSNERIQQLCSLPLFDKIRSLVPNFESKIIPIIGDMIKVNLDLNNDDEQILIDNCHIVINSGASVRFTNPLKEAIQSNVYSVQNIINLCKKLKQLQSLVHVSTAYIHPYRTDIDEVIYPMKENPNILLESLEYFDEKIFDHLSKKIFKKHPNTYTYTKSLGEYLLLQQGYNLPIAIIRPSIVGAAWREPIPGWIDSYGGVTSIMIAAGRHLFRVGHAESIVDFPVIPVDIVANMTVAIAWFTATKNNLLPTPIVYNCSTGTNNKTCLTVGEFFQTMVEEEKVIGYENYSIIEPHITFTMNKPYYYFRSLLSEVLPAYIMDMIAYLTFRKARMVKLCEKLKKLKLSMEYFCQHQWIFSNRNGQLLQEQMNNIDRQEFNFDMTGLDWSSYIRNYCIGTKKYLLKEELSKTSSKHSFVKAKEIRRLLSIIFFFAMTWIIRYMFLKRLRIIWKTINLIIRSSLQGNKKTIICFSR